AAPAPAAQSVACTAPQNPAPQSRPAPSSSAPALSPSFSLQPHPCLSPRLNLLSSRPKWPGLFFRAAFWRAGPRSGGIVATPPPPRAQVNPPLLHSYTLTLLPLRHPTPSFRTESAQQRMVSHRTPFV